MNMNNITNTDDIILDREEHKRERKFNAIKLPVGLNQSMIPKYVVYYRECYNQKKKMYREFFKIEKHPKIPTNKLYVSSKSNKINILEKLNQIKKILEKIENEQNEQNEDKDEDKDENKDDDKDKNKDELEKLDDKEAEVYAEKLYERLDYNRELFEEDGIQPIKIKKDKSLIELLNEKDIRDLVNDRFTNFDEFTKIMKFR